MLTECGPEFLARMQAFKEAQAEADKAKEAADKALSKLSVAQNIQASVDQAAAMMKQAEKAIADADAYRAAAGSRAD
jgi:hypothetical protein